MAPRAEPPGIAMFVAGQDVRLQVNEPFGRRGSRGTHHDAEARIAKHFDGPVQPAPVKPAGRRFDPGPGKLSDPHHRQAKAAHLAGVVGPVGLRPVFRIVADAELHDGTQSIGMKWNRRP